MKNRIHSLDILRGLAALSILIFHYLGSALDRELEASSILPRMGYYGVSIFYLLSGLTLALVYKNKINTVADSNIYLLKRILRIYPLMILTMVLTILYRQSYDVTTIFLNITGLFGFFDYGNYIGTGMWSIGNELVFYIFFPFLLYLFEHKKLSFNVVYGLGFLTFLIFSFFAINPEEHTWKVYINPANQFFYFLTGIFLSNINKQSIIFTKPIIAALAGILAIGVFIFYPVSGVEDYLIFGFNRIVFSLCCIVLCLSFYSLNSSINPDNIILKPLILLGEISYGVYLLHPLVSVYLSKLTMATSIGYLSALYRLPIAIGITLILSYLSYRYFEKKISKAFVPKAK
jgi:exopolysaccharide production protein ExoZ